MKKGRIGEKYRQYVGVLTVNNRGVDTGVNCWMYLIES